MRLYPFRWTVGLALLFLVGCSLSGTFLIGSWKDPAWSNRVKTIYVVGMSKHDLYRRLFEDEFSRRLRDYGVAGLPSYRDLPAGQEAGKDVISQKMAANGADSVLITRIIDKRKEELVTPGRVSGYDRGPYYAREPYAPDPYYRNWNTYYDRSFDMVYEPPRKVTYEVVTLESNLYDAKSGALIWSAQLETPSDEANIKELITDFVETVTTKLSEDGIL